MLDDLIENSNDIFEEAAARRIVTHARDFARDLMIKSQQITPINSKVTPEHVQKVWLKVRNETRNRWLRRLRELLIFIGGALFSVLVQTLLTQPGTDVPLPQVLFGMFGLFLVFVGLMIDA